MSWFKSLKTGLGAAALLLTLGAATAQAANIAMFFDPAFVPVGNDAGDEGTNLRAAAESLGHTLTDIIEITPEAFSAGLAGQDVLLIPDTEEDNLAAAISAEARQVIADFVSAGGRLVIANNDDSGNDFLLLNDIFGFNLSGDYLPGDETSNKTDAAEGTIFASAPDSLAENSATSGIDPDSLPADGLGIYFESTINIFPVAILLFGEGEVIYLGWDWFDSNPPNAGGEDGGWLEVLNQALADADLALTKTADPIEAGLDSTVTFTLTVTNNGPSDAVGVTLGDELPLGVSLLSVTPSQGTCEATAPIACELGDLANGASATVTVEVSADSSGEFSNNAAVSALTLDSNAANDSASVSFVVSDEPTPDPTISGGGCSLGAPGQALSLFPMAGLLLALAATRIRRRP